MNRLESDKNALQRRHDFSRYAVFKALDSGRLDSVSKSDVKIFIDRNGGYCSYSDADSIFRRLDQDKDGRLTYSETSDFLDSSPAKGGLAQSSADW